MAAHRGEATPTGLQPHRTSDHHTGGPESQSMVSSRDFRPFATKRTRSSWLSPCSGTSRIEPGVCKGEGKETTQEVAAQLARRLLSQAVISSHISTSLRLRKGQAWDGSRAPHISREGQRAAPPITAQR